MAAPKKFPPMKDKTAKSKAKKKAAPKALGNPFAQKGGMKPPKGMNPSPPSFPPMVGM